MKSIQKSKAFTLLEILLVIAAIGILAAIVIVAINPQRQLAQVRNAERQSDVNTLSKALEQYLIDNEGYPAGIDTVSRNICSAGSTDAGCISLDQLAPRYLAQIPRDAGESNPVLSGYMVAIDPRTNRLALESKHSELNQDIQINTDWYLLRNTQPAHLAYSLRRVSLAYGGPAIRVRRATDNQERDIGFTTQSELDVADLESFAQGGDAFVARWYDQSGNGGNAIQNTPGQQPMIVNNGTVVRANGRVSMQYDGENDFLVSTTGVPAGSRSMLMVINTDSMNATAEAFGISRNSANPGSIGLRRNLVGGWSDSPVTNTSIFIPVSSGITLKELYLETGGTYIYQSNLATIANLTSSFTFSTGVIYLGARLNSQGYANITLSEFLFYPSSYRNNREGKVNNIESYYQL